MPTPSETYISVDVETAGPNPSGYSLLAIGACTLDKPPATFYVELQPEHDRITAEAQQVCGLLLDDLRANGLPPAAALQRFAAWVSEITPPGNQPVFVALNAPFDWMFVNDAFHRHLGDNPFGHAALDIKALYMGLSGVAWQETSYAQLASRYDHAPVLSHHALQDALDQAEILRSILDEIRSRDAGHRRSNP
ncbi:MAG: 3'-5' exonuclease [Anaerolineales bacterium]|nr:3'-5' exonuclease [Anaerolineales bacterium]